MPAKYKVFVLDSAEVVHSEDDGIEREVLDGCAEVRTTLLHTEEDFFDRAAEADAIILWHQLQIGPKLLQKLTKTRIIVRNGVGYDNIDITAAAAAGIAVANVPDYGTEEVADHAIALSLALVRCLKPLMTDIAAGNWEWKTAINTRRLSTLVFGVVGCGAIGTAAALRAKALGFKVIFYDPFLASGYEKAIGVGRVDDLEDLLAEADIVSMHVPLNEHTRHLIGPEQLKQMKRSAYLVNTGRGGTVSFNAIRDALQNETIAGAGLDVLEHEPEGAQTLARFPNCIVTPHSAFYSQESLMEMRRKSAQTVKDVLLRNRFRNVVNGVERSWPID